MSNSRLAALVLAIVAVPQSVSAQSRAEASPQAALDSLLAADRAFSGLASRTSLAGALSAMFDDGVIMPLPGAAFARGRADALTALAAGGRGFSTRAQWTAIRGGLSADGRHGFTVGYIATRAPDGTLRPGKYLAYWVRRPEGWRVALYKSAPRPEGEVSTAMLPPALPPRLVAANRSASAVGAAARSLDAAERAFSDEAQRIGLGPAFARWGSEDSMNMGRDAGFRLGATNIGADMPAEVPPGIEWAPEGVLVASSGDLGVTWGWIRFDGAPAAGRPVAVPFFTVWRRASPGAPWRYVAE